jgi:hypothetical protein
MQFLSEASMKSDHNGTSEKSVEIVIRTEGQPGRAVYFSVASTERPPFADPVSVYGLRRNAMCSIPGSCLSST